MAPLIRLVLVVSLLSPGCGAELAPTQGIDSSSSTASIPVSAESTTVASVDTPGTETTKPDSGPVVSYVAAIYPVMTQPELDELVESDLPLDSESETVAGYVAEVTGKEPTSVELVDGTQATHHWLARTSTLEVDLRTAALGMRADGSEVFFVISASSMSDDWTLSAQVQPENGQWSASFIFPAPAARALVSYVSGPWQVSAETTTGEVSLKLPSEPVQQARLAIVEFDHDGNVVGLHHILLRAGAFAAG